MTDKERLLDEYLVLVARDGDRDALRQLYQRHHRPLLNHAYRLCGRRSDAEDIVQSAWGEIMTRLDQLQNPAAFRAWAYRLVTGKAGRLMRREMAERRRDAQLPEPDAPLSPDKAAEHGELRAAIAALPTAQRATVSLFYLDGLSLGEIAAVLQIPVGTAKTRLMHARHKLRETIEGDEQ